MKIAVDSNVIISLVIFDSKICKKIVEHISLCHTFVFTEEIISELLNTTFNKFTNKDSRNSINKIYDLILNVASTIKLAKLYNTDNAENEIRDKKDQSILNSILAANIEIFVTGDKDFFEKQYTNLRVMTPNEFTLKFVHHNAN